MLALRNGRLLAKYGVCGGVQALSVRNISSKPPKTDETELSKRTIPVLNKKKIKPAAKLGGKNEGEIKIKQKKRHTKKEDGEVSDAIPQHKPRATPKNYISFANFPKVPESILNASTEDLYASIGQGLGSPLSPFNKIPKPETFIDFEIPDKYLKSKIRQQITDNDRALVGELDNLAKAEDDSQISQSHLKLVKLYYDQDTNSFQPVPEHSLKKTLSGMLNLNPSLDDIDDEYLWELIPKDKAFGVPPFEQEITPNGFKKWEQEKLIEQKIANSARDSNIREFKEFEKQFTQTKSFYKKAGSRRKLDRKLVKKYKKLKEDGKLPNDDEDDTK